MIQNRDSFLATLQNNITTVLSRKNDTEIEDIEKRLNDLQIQLSISLAVLIKLVIPAAILQSAFQLI